MSEIIKDFSDVTFSTAVKTNLFELLRFAGTYPNVEAHNSPSLAWTLTGLPIPFANAVFHTHMSPDNVEEAINETMSHFESRKTPLAWFTEPSAQPDNLGSLLEVHGFEFIEGPPGMGVNLSELNAEQPLPQGLSIERVRDEDTLKLWSDLAVEGNAFPDKTKKLLFETESDIGLDQTLPWHRYIGFQDGEPLATSAVFHGAGVAGLYYVSTLPQARGQGIGTAITLKPLVEAHEMGYEIAILHASQMGFNLYRRLGFKKYCRLSFYLKDETKKDT